MTAHDRYHYTECGLDYVWLVNGVEEHETPYGKGVSVVDVDGLHRAIGLQIAHRADQMTGAEARFLRHELDLSQLALARLLGKDAQAVKRWESPGKRDAVLKGAEPRLLAALYRESVTGESDLKESLEEISELDAEFHRLMTLARTDEAEWKICA